MHLVLTAGEPVLPARQVRSLVGSEGRFYGIPAWSSGKVRGDPAEVQAEWQAQIERFTVVAGRNPTHLDSHHHLAYLEAGLFEIMVDLAEQIGAAIRYPWANADADAWSGLPAKDLTALRRAARDRLESTAVGRPDCFHSSFYGTRSTKSDLIRILAGLDDGMHEIMCHPGFTDAGLNAGTSYARERELELAVLTDREVQACVVQEGIELTDFSSCVRALDKGTE